MIIQTALLPHKHVRFSDSIIGVVGLVRKTLIVPMNVDELWSEVNRRAVNWPSKPSFTNVVLALDVLFALNQIESVADGRVRVIINETT